MVSCAKCSLFFFFFFLIIYFNLTMLMTLPSCSHCLWCLFLCIILFSPSQFTDHTVACNSIVADECIVRSCSAVVLTLYGTFKYGFCTC
jgi:hypothetical protein